jgi:hypothetical protein
MQRRTAIVLVMLGILLSIAFPVLAQFTTVPTTTEIRTYTNGINSTITIWAVGFPPSSYVRLEKQADEPSVVVPNRTRFSATVTLVADTGGSIYYADTTGKINSHYTYTFTASDGAVLVVPVSTQIYRSYIQPVVTTCYASLASRLSLGARGRALFYQTGYTRATSDALYADETNIALNSGVSFTVLNGPVCDGQGSRWWQIVTSSAAMEYDQIMYVQESVGTAYLLEPIGTSESVASWRLLPGDRPYWTPVSERFRINIRELPSWCQDEHGQYRARRIAQARYGDVLAVTGMTSDTRWVRVQLYDGTQGWTPTHLGSVNFFAPYLAYNNTVGTFVAPPFVVDPIPAWGNCNW